MNDSPDGSNFRDRAALEAEHALLGMRELEARALLDLVVQRLYGIVTGLDALAMSTPTHLGVRLNTSAELIDSTISLIRGLAPEPTGRRENLAPLQEELIRRWEIGEGSTRPW